MGVLGVLVPQRPGRETLLGVTLVLAVLAVPVHAGVLEADAHNPATPAVAGNNSTDATAVDGPSIRLVVADAAEDVVFRTDVSYLWVSTDQTTSVGVRTPAGSFERYRVCLSVVQPGSDSRRSVGCERVDASGGVDTTSTLTWTPEATGPRTLVATLVGVADSGTQVVARNATDVYLMEKTGDVDDDKLSNAEELDAGTNLTDTDSDDDGLLDGAEVTEYGTDPLLADSDADSVRDAVEIQQGTNPLVADTDGDGLDDGRELAMATDPTVADTDGDGLDDGRELDMATDPTVADTDGDGLVDGYEVHVDTDPTAADTDGDGLDDGFERSLGTDPTAAWSPAAFVVLVAGTVLSTGAMLLRRRRHGEDAKAAASDADAAADDDADDGPVTDRDRILRLLEDAGGQLKQTRIVEETDWSKAKVSRVLSSMEEDGEISKIRIGRENLICIKGREPDLARPSI